jgi:hypothetical protein
MCFMLKAHIIFFPEVDNIAPNCISSDPTSQPPLRTSQISVVALLTAKIKAVVVYLLLL